MKRTVVPIPVKLRLVLVGNGMAGFKFCEKFLKYQLYKKYDLIVYGEENYPAYDRVNLTRFFTSPNDLTLAPATWYSQNKIQLNTGEKVTSINREEKWIQTSNGKIERYDKLVLATGSNPYIPSIDGVDNPGVFVYRTLSDLSAIRDHMPKCSSAVVLGGGILGLEAARAVVQAGISTTIVEIGDHLMLRQLDAEGAATLQTLIEALGLTVLLNKKANYIVNNADHLSLQFSDKTSINSDMIIISAGISPCDELAISCGLQTGAKGGIIVNNYTLSSDPNIYAIGECALMLNRIWGLASPCFEMADVLAARLANIYKVFRGDVMFTTLKILETKVAYIGNGLNEAGDHQSLVVADKAAGIYKKITISNDGKQLLGAVLVGDTSAYSTLLQLARSRSRLPPDSVSLIKNPATEQENNILNWPNDITICICESVCKRTIVEAITGEGLSRLDQLKKSTFAGTGCESCTNVLEEMISLYQNHSKF